MSAISIIWTQIFVVVLLINLVTSQQSKGGFKCYVCTEGCEITSSTETRPCGANIGQNQEAYCTKQWQGTDDSKAIRKCQISPTGQKPPCLDGYECKYCQEDNCNSASGLQTSMMGLLSVTTLFYLLRAWILY